MRFEILNESYDAVIKSVYLTCISDYEFALTYLVPLINKLDFQRSPLRASFYKRLEDDIISGCIMPSLTIAINKNAEIPFCPTLDSDNIVPLLKMRLF